MTSILAKKTIIFLLAVITSAIVMEGILRLTDPIDYDSIVVDAKTGLLTYRPGYSFSFSSACFSNRVEVNKQGFHSKDFSLTKPKNVFRIVVLGNSLMEALHVPVDKTFSSVLEQSLNAHSNRRYRYEVIPIAFSGNATYKNLLYLEAYGLAYQPDLIIDMIGDGAGVTEEESSDQAGGYIHNGQVILRLPPVPVPTLRTKLTKLSRKSKLIRNLYRAFEVAASSFRDLRPAPMTAQFSSDSFESPDLIIESALFDKMSQIAEDNHARLLLLSSLKPGNASAERVRTLLTGLSKQSSVAYLDIFSDLANRQTQDHLPQVFSCDGHWNAHGHETSAQIVAQWLIQSSLLK